MKDSRHWSRAVLLKPLKLSVVIYTGVQVNMAECKKILTSVSLYCPIESVPRLNSPVWLRVRLWVGHVFIMTTQATMKPSDSCSPGLIMSGNLVFYNSRNLLGEMLLLCSLPGVTDGLCLFELWETSKAITLPVKRLVLARVSGC